METQSISIISRIGLKQLGIEKRNKKDTAIQEPDGRILLTDKDNNQTLVYNRVNDKYALMSVYSGIDNNKFWIGGTK